jgi:TonB family protein
MWILLSKIQIAREETVDELAVLTTGSRRAYLDALLAFVDARPLFVTTAFARRRHLIHRMLMISKESAMSSQRLVACCAAMLLAVGAAAFAGVTSFPLSAQQNPPRDPPPPPPPPASGERMVFVVKTEAELQAAIDKDPKNAGLYHALARHYARVGDFDRAVATLESLALADPSSPQHHHTLAVFYWEKAYRDATLPREQKTTYLLAGIAAADRAIAMDPDYAEALTYKNILLRTLATYTTEPGEQLRIMKEADLLRARAIELMKQRPTAAGAALRDASMPPPPPPPPPPFGMVDGMAPLRVGGNIPPPAKIKDVRPVYPPIAQANGVSGVVIIEAVIDTDGRVRDARVLRSIPLLDHAALDAVKEWQYLPTTLEGVARPVIMTLTVNFSLQ